jgi:UDP-glucose:(heptosyl)LPS alpha-1,3-glucosyltransferase
MKLGLLIDSLQRPLGGLERHTLALLRRAHQEEEDVAIATLVGGVDRGLLPEGVTVHEVSAPKTRPERDQALAEQGAALLREQGRRILALRHALDCDVYLPHGGLVDDARAAKDRAVGGPSRWTRIARAFSRRHAFFLEAEAALLGTREGPRVIAVSNTLAARIKQVYPAAAPRVRVVINGVDEQYFERSVHRDRGQALRAQHVPAGALAVLLMAHNLRLKGVETAIRALARPEVMGLDMPVHLLIAGARLDRKARALARSLGIAGQVHELGGHADPRPVYAAADLLVHPTWYDPCSLVCLEALAMELPVITTPVNGVRDVMGMRGGIVVEAPGNPEYVAVAIRVLSDAALRVVTADDARYLALRNRETTRLDAILDIWRSG